MLLFNTIFLIYINSCLGAYRSASKNIFNSIYGNDPTQKLKPEEINEILSNIITPWSSVGWGFIGVILTFVGLTFAFISVMDGFTYNDTYSGYGNVGRKVNDYKDEIKKTFTSYAKEVSQLFGNFNKDLQNSFSGILKNELNYWDANTNLIQKEFTAYEQKVGYAVRQSKHIIDEYRKENIRVRKSKPPSFFSINFSIPEDVKDPKKAFRDVVFHYMTDEQREKTKIKFSESIDQKFKQAEKEVEDLQKASVEKQNELHEKYNTH